MRVTVAVLLTAAFLVAAPATGDAHGRPPRPVDLDVLFVGAHPDDEAFDLSVLGAWGEEFGARTGVVTVTRGEGGGNAVGPEEGPPLGLLREAEERRAVGRAGIRDVFNLDKVDFYYTVSAPLTRSVWDERETLARVVRVVRETRPEVIVTMDPSPAPGNHGHHQLAARLAVEAFADAAGGPRFGGQITEEGLRPWRVKRIFRDGAAGRYTATAARSASRRSRPPSRPTRRSALWSGVRARSGLTWAQIAREAQREYASQGWAGFPDEPADPAEIGCARTRRSPRASRMARPTAAARRCSRALRFARRAGCRSGRSCGSLPTVSTSRPAARWR